MGIQHVRLVDFDVIERLNLDRVLHARSRDVLDGVAKVELARRAMLAGATAAEPGIDPLEWSVVEKEGFRVTLDCDVLFSRVDRPWPRAALNLIAYAHLIPVVDGGIVVSRTTSGQMRGADWRAHIAAPGRPCLECPGQYNPGLVQMEREGRLDDPTYIERLAENDPLRPVSWSQAGIPALSKRANSARKSAPAIVGLKYGYAAFLSAPSYRCTVAKLAVVIERGPARTNTRPPIEEAAILVAV